MVGILEDKTSDYIRYVVEVRIYGEHVSLARVKDKKENKYICSCSEIQNAKDIVKAMNVLNSWEPILTNNEHTCTGCYSNPCICEELE
jgi:hypothetical protein